MLETLPVFLMEGVAAIRMIGVPIDCRAVTHRWPVLESPACKRFRGP